MGGRVRLMICGSAPLQANVLTFMRCALGCVVVEGYGQTECVAAATVSLEGDNTPGLYLLSLAIIQVADQTDSRKSQNYIWLIKPLR